VPDIGIEEAAVGYIPGDAGLMYVFDIITGDTEPPIIGDIPPIAGVTVMD
jgi:hypothetical protein